jgi:hypothetical protein
LNPFSPEQSTKKDKPDQNRRFPKRGCPSIQREINVRGNSIPISAR